MPQFEQCVTSLSWRKNLDLLNLCFFNHRQRLNVDKAIHMKDQDQDTTRIDSVGATVTDSELSSSWTTLWILAKKSMLAMLVSPRNVDDVKARSATLKNVLNPTIINQQSTCDCDVFSVKLHVKLSLGQQSILY